MKNNLGTTFSADKKSIETQTGIKLPKDAKITQN